MSDKPVTKHNFRYGEETYTICITIDDWWLDESVDMSERMMKAGTEFALDHGMLPREGLCVECYKGKYVDVIEDYHIGGTTIKDLDLHRCYRCGHTTLPWQSVEKVDKVLEVAKKPAELCPTCRESNTIEVTGDVKLETKKGSYRM